LERLAFSVALALLASRISAPADTLEGSITLILAPELDELEDEEELDEEELEEEELDDELDDELELLEVEDGVPEFDPPPQEISVKKILYVARI